MVLYNLQLPSTVMMLLVLGLFLLHLLVADISVLTVLALVVDASMAFLSLTPGPLLQTQLVVVLRAQLYSLNVM
jgi:hypothetical protein